MFDFVLKCGVTECTLHSIRIHIAHYTMYFNMACNQDITVLFKQDETITLSDRIKIISVFYVALGTLSS